MDWKQKALGLLIKVTESKYLNKAETCIVGAINRLSVDPKVVTTEAETKKVVEVV